MIKRHLFSCFLLAFSMLPSSCDKIQDFILSNQEIVSGLKEALNQGARVAVQNLGVTDGYFKDKAVKILLPEDAVSLIQSSFEDPIYGALVKVVLEPAMLDLIEKMNRGAEKAATKAVPIFVSAIDSMSISDGLTILKGNDSAATNYLRGATYQPLTKAFAPEINAAMDEVGAATAWENIFTYYNQYANLANWEKINPDLGEYATGKALDGLFLKVGVEEKAIRNDVSKRGTDLLKKVFKEQD